MKSVIHKLELKQLLSESTTISRDNLGPKVVILPSGEYLKLFRRKRLIPRSSIRPYAYKFFHNAKRLKQKNILTVDVKDVGIIPDSPFSYVRYTPLPGISLRELMRNSGINEFEPLIDPLCNYINYLHDLGIYCRSLQLGNIVLTSDHDFGLIGISNVKFFERSMKQSERSRNMRNLEDNIAFENFDSSVIPIIKSSYAKQQACLFQA